MVRGGIWIQGAGELASGIGMRLARCGYGVIMAEIAHPLAVRRLVAFSEAVYSGTASVEGVQGVLAEPGTAASTTGDRWRDKARRPEPVVPSLLAVGRAPS